MNRGRDIVNLGELSVPLLRFQCPRVALVSSTCAALRSRFMDFSEMGDRVFLIAVAYIMH